MLPEGLIINTLNRFVITDHMVMQAINAGGITAARTLAGGPDVWKGEKIALSSNKLGDKAGSYIANVLSTNTFLKVLHLDDNLLDAGSGEVRTRTQR